MCIFSISKFEYLAKNNPQELITLIKDGLLEAADLTFAIEIAGRIKGYDIEVMEVFRLVMTHDSAYVREGVVYGLAQIGNCQAKELLRQLNENDKSPEVRQAAIDALEVI